MRTLLLIALGGGVGSVLRYLTAVFALRYFKTDYPLGTFLANALGCFIIGILVSFFARQESNPELKALFITGFCGGFTTFSTFASENVALFQNQNHAMALLHIGLSLFAGLLFVWLGLWIGSKI